MTTSRHIRYRLMLLMMLITLATGFIPVSHGQAAPAVSASAPSALAAATAQETPASAVRTEPEPLIFSDDFEAYGDSSLWSRQFPFLVEPELGPDGSFAAHLKSSGERPVYGQKTLSEAYPRFFVRMRFQIIDHGSQPFTLLNLRPTTTSSFLTLRVEPTGQISYQTGATGILAKSTTGIETGRWYDIQIFADRTGEDHTVRIWLDQVELTSMRQEAFLGDGGLKILQVGDTTAGRDFDFAVDDIRVDDTFIPANRGADPVSGTLTVRAIPVWSGITYTLDGKTYVSDESGVARIKVERWSTDLRSRIQVGESFNESGSKATFTQWRKWISAHSNDVNATFRISNPVEFSFVDLDGNPVDASMIDKLVIKSSTGEIIELTADHLSGPVLLTSTVITTPDGLATKAITYMVDQVFIDGANVVHRRQQSTTFERERHWQIKLLFYGVRFAASDAFFGSPLGKELVIEAADGTTQRLKLDANGEVTIPRLPRGEYAVSVIGAGYSPPRPIMVSRNQVVELEVISHLDIALVLIMAVISVSGLLVIGRPFLFLTPLRVLRNIFTNPPWLRSRETMS